MTDYTSDQIIELLGQNVIFQPTSLFPHFLKEDLEDFLNIARINTIKAGETVFEIGEKADSIILILSGEVGIFIPEKDKLVHIACIGEKSFVGEMGIIDEKPRSATVKATKDSLLGVVADRDFWLYFKIYPAIAINLIKSINQRFNRDNIKLKDSLIEENNRLIQKIEVSGRGC